LIENARKKTLIDYLTDTGVAAADEKHDNNGNDSNGNGGASDQVMQRKQAALEELETSIHHRLTYVSEIMTRELAIATISARGKPPVTITAIAAFNINITNIISIIKDYIHVPHDKCGSRY
jgi:hypothetical protein